MTRLCGQSPTRDDVQLFISPCRRRYQSHRRWLPKARQSSFSTRSSATSFCGSRLFLLVTFTTATYARGFGAHHVPGTTRPPVKRLLAVDVDVPDTAARL